MCAAKSVWKPNCNRHLDSRGTAEASSCQRPPAKENFWAHPNYWESTCVPVLKHPKAAQPRGKANAAFAAFAGGDNKRNYTEAQEQLFSKLSSELAQQCRDAFSNTVSRTSHAAKSHSSLGYGLDSITDVHRHVTAEKLQKFFPDILLSELVRPREIQLVTRKVSWLHRKSTQWGTLCCGMDHWERQLLADISHLIASSPHSIMTPVRLVWNSSQKFQSLNDLLLKAPDVLNPICAVLLKFRRVFQGVFAALGDIKKIYNSVLLEDQGVYLHRYIGFCGVTPKKRSWANM